MAFQTVFKRYELKYLLTKEQKQAVCDALAAHMKLDSYGRTAISNIYFDTDKFRLVRRSIERPVYKEKLRIRSYSQATSDSTVFVELKKKFDSVVYKRRIALSEIDATLWLSGISPCPKKTQIADEIEYFMKYYGTLRPRAFLSYEREAFYATDGSDFRVTFDEQILARLSDLSLCSDIGGYPLLEDGMTLMEIKCSGGIPLWMMSILSQQKIYKTSFSKYGTAYKKLIAVRGEPACGEFIQDNFIQNVPAQKINISLPKEVRYA